MPRIYKREAPENLRSAKINFTLKPGELKLIASAAQRRGVSLSDFTRDTVVSAASLVMKAAAG